MSTQNRSQKASRKKDNEFLTSYNALGDMKKKARDRVMDKCGWSRPTFFAKLNAERKMSEAEQQAVRSIFEEAAALEKLSTESLAKA